MHINSFTPLHPNINLIFAPDLFFSSISKEFSKYFQAGMFDESKNASILVYQVIQNGKTYCGIVNNTDINDLIDKKILFHEETIADKEQDMVQSSLERKAMVKPVMLFHKKNQKLADIIQKTIKNKKEDFNARFEGGINHSFWSISDSKTITVIKNIFEKEIDKAYIADGHHRCSSTLRLYQNKTEHFKSFHFESMLTAYFSMDQLEVYDHIKIVSILDTLKPEIFIAKLSRFADIRHVKKMKRPSHKHEFVVALNDEIYKGAWKKGVLREFEKKGELLDVFIMNELVFQDIFKIPDVRKDSRISYFSGNESEDKIFAHLKSIPSAIAIMQYPLQIKEIMEVADSGVNLPPKSTWFEPKVKSGIIVQKYV